MPSLPTVLVLAAVAVLVAVPLAWREHRRGRRYFRLDDKGRK